MYLVKDKAETQRGVADKKTKNKKTLKKKNVEDTDIKTGAFCFCVCFLSSYYFVFKKNQGGA